MKRPGTHFSLVLSVLVFATISIAQEMKQETKSKTTSTTKATKKPARSTSWKIQNATSAAPASIAKNATVMDFPATEGAEMPVLRKGTNDWTCLPDFPDTPANDPMCMDKMAMEWAQAWMGHKEPSLSATGIGYMLQGGGSASNTDPFATKPGAGESWMKEPPHLMIFPAAGMKLDPNVYGTDMHSGGPWIMWGGTPYEHLMVPVK
ncbi:MAG TPA: hypothetical protein VGQ75_09430 [Thermoanaerobaculia bacterium]|nr:hypothetical protein [Thermoanaerobaculia bacterium]